MQIAKREQAIALAKQGLSYNKIAKQVGCAKSSVSLWCRDILSDLTPEQQSEKLKRDRVVNVEKRDIARKRYLENDAIKIIASDLKVNPCTIIRWTKDLVRPKSFKRKTLTQRPQSKAPLAEHPFSCCRIYHSTNKHGYKSVSLIHTETLKQTTMSYGRYLMCVKEGRVLDPQEVVKHIEGNEDVIENLRIKIKGQPDLLVLEKNKQICASCEEPFVRKRSSQVTCSRECSGVYRTKQKAISPQVCNDRPCKGCFGMFTPSNASVRYCSEKCKPVPVRTDRSNKRSYTKKEESNQKVVCVVCEGTFIPDTPDREHCYAKYCDDVIRAEDE